VHPDDRLPKCNTEMAEDLLKDIQKIIEENKAKMLKLK